MRNLNWQIHRYAAVDEQPPVDLNGRKGSRDGHARTYRHADVTRAEHNGFARNNIGCDRAKRDHQLIEVVHTRHRQSDSRHDHVDDLTLDDAGRQSEFTVVETRPLLHEKPIVVLFSPKRLQLPRHRIEESGAPIDVSDEGFKIVDRHARSVYPPDRGPYARSRDIVDGNAQFLERPQYADVCAAASPSARQHEADAWSAGRARRIDFLAGGHRERNGNEGSQARYCCCFPVIEHT